MDTLELGAADLPLLGGDGGGEPGAVESLDAFAADNSEIERRLDRVLGVKGGRSSHPALEGGLRLSILVGADCGVEEATVGVSVGHKSLCARSVWGEGDELYLLQP